MHKALFVAYGGGHVAMVIPTIQEMQRRGGWTTTVLGLTTACTRLRAAGLPYLAFRDLLQPDDARAKSHGERLAKENHTPGTGVPYEESVAYLGLSYADLEDRLGAAEAERLYAERKRHAFLPVGPLKRLIAAESPDVVVVTSAPRAERAAVIAARELGVPSIVMIDLFGKEWDYLFDPTYGDTTLVFAPSVYDDYLRRGRTPDNLVLTGNPAFDRLACSELAEAGRRWRSEQHFTGKQVVLWAATPVLTTAHREEAMRALSECTRRHPDWVVLFRPHPSMAIDPQTPLPPGCRLVDNKVDLAVHLHAADCVLVTISTCGIEAALLDKPVVKMQFVDPQYRIFDATYPHMDALAPYEEMEIAVPARRLEELDAVIQSALPGGSSANRLRQARRSLPPVGRATGNVVDAIQQVVARCDARSSSSSAA